MKTENVEKQNSSLLVGWASLSHSPMAPSSRPLWKPTGCSLFQRSTFMNTTQQNKIAAPPLERLCIRCDRTWTSRTGVKGYNKCPHCDGKYNADEAAGLASLALQRHRELVAVISAQTVTTVIAPAAKATQPTLVDNAAAWDKFAASGKEAD
jgi:hypothetical protein